MEEKENLIKIDKDRQKLSDEKKKNYMILKKYLIDQKEELNMVRY